MVGNMYANSENANVESTPVPEKSTTKTDVPEHFETVSILGVLAIVIGVLLWSGWPSTAA